MRFKVTSYFQLDQRRDIAPRLELAGRYSLVSGFHRAKACIEIEKEYQIRYPGGDYITYHYCDEKILFVVCDGVSGGFGGYIASRFLGNQLIGWLQRQDFTTSDATGLLDPLTRKLYDWIPDATRLVNAAPFLIPPTDEADRKFKEKRKARGAQTMFVAGVLDSQNNTADFLWMGDVRLLLDFKDSHREIRNKFDGWSRHRWSTREGPKGTPGGCRYRCSELRRVVVYTDGLSAIVPETEIGSWKEENFLGLQFAQPPDDVSVLVINITPSEWRAQPVLDIPRPISSEKLGVEFDEIPEGAWIRIKGRINNSIYAVDLEPRQTVFRPAEYDLAGRGRYEFQLVSGEKLPSHYTQPIPLYGKSASPVVPISAPPKPVPPKPSPITPRPHPVSPPRPVPAGLRSRLLLSLAGWVLAILGWGVAAYLFFRLSQAQGYAEEQQRRVNELMATVTSLEMQPSPLPTTQSFPLVEDITPTQTTILPTTTPVLATPSSEPPLEASTVGSPLPTPIPTALSPTVSSTSVSGSENKTGYGTPIPTLGAVGRCRKFTTIAEGLILYLEPDESSQLVFNVPISHTLNYLDAEEEWYLLQDEGGESAPIRGWARLQSLDEFTRCMDE